MVERKYGKYVITHSIEEVEPGPAINIIGERDFNSDFSIVYLPIRKPMVVESFPHKHDFDIYLTFLGFNPDGLEDLGGEIEVFLGEEQEKYMITSPTSIYIPKGFIHSPTNIIKVDSPILLIHATLAPRYIKIHKPE